MRKRHEAGGSRKRGGALPGSITGGSSSWIEEAPGDGSDVVEELEGGLGLGGVDGAGTDEEAEVSVDLSG